jgi:hypothetical protein
MHSVDEVRDRSMPAHFSGFMRGSLREDTGPVISRVLGERGFALPPAGLFAVTSPHNFGSTEGVIFGLGLPISIDTTSSQASGYTEASHMFRLLKSYSHVDTEAKRILNPIPACAHQQR